MRPVLPRGSFGLVALLLTLFAASASGFQATQARSLPSDEWGELVIRGRLREISVSPAGTVWLGGSYVADSITGDWRYGPLALRDTTETLFPGPILVRVSFFDADTAIATGYVTHGHDLDRGYLYRTIDGGRSWDSVSIGAGVWIYDVFVGRAGRAWMGGSNGVLYHTRDHGRTWRAVSAPFDESSRLGSIYMMADARHGVIGAHDDAIKITDDGGLTWRSVPTPISQGVLARRTDDGGSDWVDFVAFVGGQLVVRENGELFATDTASIRWRRLPGLRAVAYDRAQPGRLVGVTDSLVVVALDTALRATPLATARLEVAPRHVEARDGAVWVVDEADGLSHVAAGRLTFGYPLTSSHPIRYLRVVRRSGDRLWGVAWHHVYVSDTLAIRWRRVGRVRFEARGAVALDRDRLLLWDGHGTNAVLDARTGQVETVRDFGGDDVVDIVTGGPLWIAYGGMQYETARRVEVARSFFWGQFRGTRDSGFVYVSRDSGRSWRLADRWPEGGVMAVHRVPSGDLLLLSYLGSVRRLTPRGEGFTARTLLTATDANRDRVPYVERAYAIHFTSPDTGLLGGWIHHLGDRHFRTVDGGRNWKRVEGAQFPYRQIVPVGDGHLARTDSALFHLRGGTRQLGVPPGPGTIRDLSPIDGGRALVEWSAVRNRPPRVDDTQWRAVTP